MPGHDEIEKSRRSTQPNPDTKPEYEPEIPCIDSGEDELPPSHEIPNVALRKSKPRVSEVNRKVEELMIAHNETNKEMADAIVSTAYKQTSRYYDLEFTNRQQQQEIEILKAKMARLES